MVEVLDIQRNFKNGTEIIKKKMKNNTLTRGRATIQLFDENNNCIEETISNNFITNPVKTSELYYKLASELGVGLSNYSIADTRFKQIQLRKGDFEEDESTLIPRGKVVGYCNRTDTSGATNTLKGMYNQLESFTEYTEDGYYHAHLVYDFGTSQANGEFNHIYWTPTGDSTTYPVNYLKRGDVIGYDSGHLGDNNYYIDVFGNLLLKKNSQYYMVKNKGAILSKLSKVPQIDEKTPTSYYSSNMRIGDNKCVTVAGNSTQASTKEGRTCEITFNIYSDYGALEKSKTINLLSLEGFARLNEKMGAYSGHFEYDRVVFVTDEGRVYFSIKLSAYKSVIPTVSQDGQYTEGGGTKYLLLCYDVVNDVWVIEPNPYDYICNTKYNSNVYNYNKIKVSDNEYLFFSGYTVCLLNLETFTFENVGSTGNGYFDRGLDLKNNLAMTYVGSSAIVSRIIPYSSHTKLPNPVVKTNTNTMKITYDYYIQLPNLFAESGKEFSWD